MKLSRREQWLLGFAGLAFVLTLGFYFGIKPLLEQGSPGEAGSLKAQIVTARRLLAKAESIRTRREELAKALTETETSFLDAASTDRGGIALLALVEKLAAQAGIALNTKGINQVKPGATPPTVEVEIRGRGDAGAVTKFLYAIRTATYRMDVQSLDLVASEDKTLEIRTVITTLLPHAEGEQKN